MKAHVCVITGEPATGQQIREAFDAVRSAMGIEPGHEEWANGYLVNGPYTFDKRANLNRRVKRTFDAIRRIFPYNTIEVFITPLL